MSEQRQYRILISGGGTGGHIFPALSIAGELKRRHPDAELLFIGALGRMEMEKVPAAGYRIIGLPVMGFDRKRLWRNFKVLYHLMVSMAKARRIIKEFNPDIAIGVGGYVSGPVLKEAQRQGISTLIQEQNSFAGVTNKMLAKRADAICVAYSGMERFFPAEKIVLTGNPVRRGLSQCSLTPEEARRQMGLRPDVPTILVVGGSLGAKTFNDSIALHFDEIADSHVQVIWQTGKQGIATATDTFASHDPKGRIVHSAFIPNMDVAYRAADLVVSRAGASSISELQILGKPAVLVPSPNVAEDHQTHNAMALVNEGAAILVRDTDAREKLVTTMIDTVADSAQLAQLATNIKKMALTEADSMIADRAEQLMNRKK